MGYQLNNCTITSFQSNENANDSIIGGFELQTPPTGALIYLDNPSSTGEINTYYLVITPNVNYKVNRSNITIGNVDGDVSYTDLHPNGISIYSNISSIDADQNIEQIKIYDYDNSGSTSGVNYLNCNNKVIIEIKYISSFVMPASNYVSNINFNGSASQCANTLPGFEIFELVNRVSVTNSLDLTSNVGVEIFHARGFESEAYANNKYDSSTNYGSPLSSTSIIGAASDAPAPIYAGAFDYNGYGTGLPLVSLMGDCYESFSPTCYQPLQDIADNPNNYYASGLYKDPALFGNPNNVWTECGRELFTSVVKNMTGVVATEVDYFVSAQTGNFIVSNQSINEYVKNTAYETLGETTDLVDIPNWPNGSITPFMFDPDRFPDNYIYNPSGDSLGKYLINTRVPYVKFAVYNINFIPQYLSDVDYPTLEPGGPVIPNKWVFWLSVGDNPDYDLLVESIEIWGGCTVKKTMLSVDSNFAVNSSNTQFVSGGGGSSWQDFGQQSCDLLYDNGEPVISYELIQNDDGTWPTNSEHHFDLANAVVTQGDDNKTVKVEIPFRTDLSIKRTFAEVGDFSGSSFLSWHNNIFMNINPIQIDN